MTVRVIVGDALEQLRLVPDSSAHCCVTSPPYWGLRDYGVAGQIGLEPTPDEYIGKLSTIFAEVARVLTDDGTLWLNMGDSYASGGTRSRNSGGAVRGSSGTLIGYRPRPPGAKAKDLLMMPARVALALQADGWYLRSDIIWAKPNPMPESVTDRPTKSHEYVFLLSKSPRYYYDGVAIREPLVTANEIRFAGEGNGLHSGESHAGVGSSTRRYRKGDARGRDRRPSGWADDDDHGSRTGRYRSGNAERKPASARGVPVDTGGSANGAVADSVPWEDDGTGRNARTVWTIATEPFKGAHFATFPTELARRCIAAGSARGDTILDPFGGAGTTGLVADRMGRDALLIELNPTYAALAERRIHADAPLFSGLGPDGAA